MAAGVQKQAVRVVDMDAGRILATAAHGQVEVGPGQGRRHRASWVVEVKTIGVRAAPELAGHHPSSSRA
jgi:hypothetical protein